MELGTLLDVICNEFTIELFNGKTKLFSQAAAWGLLNLKPKAVFDIPKALSAVLNLYLIQTCGKGVLESKFNIKPSKYFVGTTNHYSWPKGTAITSIGSKHILNVPVNINVCMDSSTLMELGISPILASGTIMQLLARANLIEININLKEDCALFGAAQKQPSELGAGVCLLLILQLIISALIVILLNELLQKGYGLGLGVLLFIATNICKSIVWKAFSPTTVNTGHGPKFEGAIVALFHMIFTWNNKLCALKEAFQREHLPNIMSLFATIVVFAVFIYLQGFPIKISVKSNQFRGQRGTYPVKLFYTSNMPIMLESELTSNVYILSQMLFNRFPNNFLVCLLGVWEPLEDLQQLMAKLGIAYYMSPHTLKAAFLNPIHTAVYITFILSACALFSKTWIEVSGLGPRNVAKQLKDQQMVMASHRKGSMYKELKRVIPTAAAFCSTILGLLSVLADLMGALGSGTSILTAVTIIYSYCEIGMRESGGPEMAALGDLM